MFDAQLQFPVSFFGDIAGSLVFSGTRNDLFLDGVLSRAFSSCFLGILIECASLGSLCVDDFFGRISLTGFPGFLGNANCCRPLLRRVYEDCSLVLELL